MRSFYFKRFYEFTECYRGYQSELNMLQDTVKSKPLNKIPQLKFFIYFVLDFIIYNVFTTLKKDIGGDDDDDNGDDDGYLLKTYPYFKT